MIKLGNCILSTKYLVRKVCASFRSPKSVQFLGCVSVHKLIHYFDMRIRELHYKTSSVSNTVIFSLVEILFIMLFAGLLLWAHASFMLHLFPIYGY